MANQLKTILLLATLSALLVTVGGALAPKCVYLFGLMGLIMPFISYFFSDRIVLAMNRAQEVSEAEQPRLHAMVADLATRAGLPKPRVFLVNDPQPNAFATGRNPEHGIVAVNTGLLRLLSEREVRGVIAHELAHIKNRDILIASVAAMIASVISSIANVVQWGAMFGGLGRDRDDDEGGMSGIGALALAIVAPIAATVIQLAISRSREYVADETGGRISGDPEGLAMALERLHMGVEHIPSVTAQPATASLNIDNPFAGRGLMSIFSTHPPMVERVARLREQARLLGVPSNAARAQPFSA